MAKKANGKVIKKYAKPNPSLTVPNPELFRWSLSKLVSYTPPPGSGLTYNFKATITVTFADSNFDADPTTFDPPIYEVQSVKVGGSPVTSFTVSTFLRPALAPPPYNVVEANLFIQYAGSTIPRGTSVEVTVSVRKKRTSTYPQP